jgi:hypothetical protein
MPERSPLWRIDRQITLGVLVTLALQTASGLVWAGATSERIRHLEARAETAAPVLERLARLEEHSVHTRTTLERIERRLAGE